MQNQWECWTYFPATRCSHLGWGVRDFNCVPYIPACLGGRHHRKSSYTHDIGNRRRTFRAFVVISRYSALTLIQNVKKFGFVSNMDWWPKAVLKVLMLISWSPQIMCHGVVPVCHVLWWTCNLDRNHDISFLDAALCLQSVETPLKLYCFFVHSSKSSIANFVCGSFFLACATPIWKCPQKSTAVVRWGWKW